MAPLVRRLAVAATLAILAATATHSIIRLATGGAQRPQRHMARESDDEKERCAGIPERWRGLGLEAAERARPKREGQEEDGGEGEIEKGASRCR